MNDPTNGNIRRIDSETPRSGPGLYIRSRWRCRRWLKARALCWLAHTSCQDAARDRLLLATSSSRGGSDEDTGSGSDEDTGSGGSSGTGASYCSYSTHAGRPRIHLDLLLRLLLGKEQE